MKENNSIISARKIIFTEIKALRNLSKSINKSFVQAVNLLCNTRGRVICCGVGKSARILEKISSTFSSIGISSFTLDPTDASHGSLGAIKKNDILIIASFSGNSSELNNILKYTKKLSTKVIGISSNLQSNLIKNSNIKIIMPQVKEAGNDDLNMIPTSSSINLLSLGDCLAITIAERKKFNKKKFGTFHPSGSLGKNLSSINEIMVKGKNIPIVQENTTIQRIVITMSSKRLGCAVVLKNRNIIGFISDGDMNRAIKKYKNFYNKKAKDIMTSKPLIIRKTLLITEALKLMNQKKITVLLVAEKQRLIGIVHLHDILKFLNT